MQHVYALILAGGSGTRFWPASRKTRPKQLLAIAPGSDRPLIVDAVRRLEPVCPADRIYVSTGEALLEATRAALPDVPEKQFLAEPLARNTAPCIAWATQVIRQRDPEAVVVVVPADQHIGDEDEYLRVVNTAVESARAGAITTLGIVPSRPETGYGYIEVAAASAKQQGALPVVRFVEKPDAATAEQYLAAGTYYWNAGMFFYRADVMLDAIARHLPELAVGLEAIAGAVGAGAEQERAAVRTAFEGWPSISIDYGVMEKASGIAVVPADVRWSDLGSWRVAWELAAKDEDGNAVDPGTLVVAASGSLVRDLSAPGRKRAVALVGVEDLCVIQTDDAVLVVARERAQEVREVIDQLRNGGRDHLL